MEYEYALKSQILMCFSKGKTLQSLQSATLSSSPKPWSSVHPWAPL